MNSNKDEIKYKFKLKKIKFVLKKIFFCKFKFVPVALATNWNKNVYGKVLKLLKPKLYKNKLQLNKN